MSRETVLASLRRKTPIVAPSLLKCDFGNMQREIQLLESAGAAVLHLDVMDGHFVPNLSYGAPVIRSWREYTPLVFDAHLMISDPARYLDDFIAAGCQVITVHVEATGDPRPVLRRIREAGCVAGLALNPGTPVSDIEPALAGCDLVLVMSVEPGFGGQSFLPESLDKVREIRDLAGENLLISIDGGIDAGTIGPAAAAGAELFVAGTSIFGQPDYRSAMTDLRAAAQQATTEVSSR